jgi:hypothetical protein
MGLSKISKIDWLVQFTSNCKRNAKVSIVPITVVDSSFMVGMLLPFQNAVETIRLLVKVTRTLVSKLPSTHLRLGLLR